MVTTTFETAQDAVWRRYDLATECWDLPVPSLGGRAHGCSVGSGPSIVMLNGLGVPAAMWAPLMARLGGVRLHAVDLPGFGLTDGGADVADDLREAAVDFVGEVIDGLGLDRPVVIGSSLGSLWSIWFAARHPQRVDALVHIGCPALAPGSSAPLPMRLLSVRGLGRLITRLDPPSPSQVERLAKTVGEHPLPPEIAELIVETERRPSFRPTLLAMSGELLRIRGARPGLGLTEAQLAEVAQPSALVLGRSDPMGGEIVGRRFVDALQDGELHLVHGGHAPWLHHADEVARAVASFLYERRSITIAMP